MQRVAAVVLALTAVWVVRGSDGPAGADTVAVTVATRGIPAGSPIVAADLRSVHWPQAARLPAPIDLNRAIGQRAVSDIAAGEPITSSRVSSSVWSGLRPGERAFTVPLADPMLATLLRAGDRVDLYDPADHRLVASNVRVVMSATAQGDATSGRSSEFTLAVAVDSLKSPRFAEALSNSASLGTGLIVAARPAA